MFYLTGRKSCADCKWHTCSCSCMVYKKEDKSGPCRSACIKKKMTSKCSNSPCVDFEFERIERWQ